MFKNFLFRGRIACALLLMIVPSLSFSANLLEVYELAINSDPELKRAEAVRLESLEAGPQSKIGRAHV